MMLKRDAKTFNLFAWKLASSSGSLDIAKRTPIQNNHEKKNWNPLNELVIELEHIGFVIY